MLGPLLLWTALEHFQTLWLHEVSAHFSQFCIRPVSSLIYMYVLLNTNQWTVSYMYMTPNLQRFDVGLDCIPYSQLQYFPR